MQSLTLQFTTSLKFDILHDLTSYQLPIYVTVELLKNVHIES